MNHSILSLGALALLGSIVLTGCSEQPFGPEAMGGDVALGASALTPASAGDPTTPAGAAEGSVRLEAKLTASSADPLASGGSEFVSHTGPTKRRFRIDVQDVSTDGIGFVLVRRGGQVVLEQKLIIVDGSADLDLETANGQQLPLLRAGDQVQVLNPSGKVILYGTLHR